MTIVVGVTLLVAVFAWMIYELRTANIGSEP